MCDAFFESEISFDEEEIEVCKAFYKILEIALVGYGDTEYQNVVTDMRFYFCNLAAEYMKLLGLKMRDMRKEQLELLKQYRELCELVKQNYEQS